ncbi:unnamed protein product [Haemonchus placei]|uniref:VWFA domain-containing protein n=1 Tax=Haemonchus placei TaxID=6290 RepID=A0A0N4W7E2_HAEPC|nr:unnamed protein product [Haemonchus placei]
MLRLILYALFLAGFVRIGYAEESLCASTDSVRYSCERHVVIAIDDISDIANDRGQEYSMTRSVLRYLNIRNDSINVALATYGTDPFTSYTSYSSTRDTVCNDLVDLWLDNRPANDVTPSRKIQDLVSNITTKIDLNNALLILFTKDNEQEDVDATSGMLRWHIHRGTFKSLSAIVVNMGNSSFDTWLENSNVNVNSWNNVDYVADMIGRYVCGK